MAEPPDAKARLGSAYTSPPPPPSPPPPSPTPSFASSFFSRPLPLYLSAGLLRAGLLLYGLWQDANSPVKYTDIDYLVFTDAARFVSLGRSPYERETYRYSPVLAWMLLPTAKGGGSGGGAGGGPAWWTAACFSSGKVLFAAADLVAGWLIERVLTTTSTTTTTTTTTTTATAMTPERARRFAAIWLLNPMVAAISTRGSSEGLLGVLVMALLWAVLARRVALAGLILGFSVHFKIYPFIYAPAIAWWMDAERMTIAPEGGPREEIKGKAAPAVPSSSSPPPPLHLTLVKRLMAFATPDRLRLAFVSLATFLCLNLVMFYIYGPPFLVHTYFHHVTRIDHRHNFSLYNMQLYLASAFPGLSSRFRAESLAFFPQLLLSCVLIPLVAAKKDLATSMLAQTFAFVAFNKVCTSQYFLWYMIFLPLYLPRSSFLRNKAAGVAALALWVASQGLWLQQAFRLEFLGESTFLPGLWCASLAFFLVNCWILGVFIADAGEMTATAAPA